MTPVDHMQLLCDFGELSWAFSDSANIEAFLQKIVTMVADHMKADVCSIYLYEEEAEKIVLKATRGLSPKAVNTVSLELGEGLVGMALKDLRPIRERVGSMHPNFKPIPGIFEERYEAFLAVPILRGVSRIGVLTLQRSAEKPFQENDVMAMRAIASQLANILASTNLLMAMDERAEKSAKTADLSEIKFIKGKAAAEGFAFAPATVVDRGESIRQLLLKDFAKRYSVEDFRQAIKSTEEQLTTLQAQVGERLSDAASLIFTSHLLMLKDRAFIQTIEDLIAGGDNPPHALVSVAMKYIDIFSKSSNPYVREKVLDVEDLVVRLITAMTSDQENTLSYRDSVVIARELFPSDLLKMSTEDVKGIVMASGGVTSHLSILAKSLKIPMIIVEEPRLLGLPRRTPVLLDAELGNIYVNPADDVISSFNARNTEREKLAKETPSMQPVTYTRDGVRVTLLANINLLTDLKLARELKCEGIGLYRTEFPFIIRSDLPCEEEQYVVYHKLTQEMTGKEITFRTLDIGGDKVLPYFPGSQENNPFLGMRSIRFSLRHRDVFAAQIRAMLRAGAGENLKIMFPMITSLEEFIEARRTVLECAEALQREKIEHNGNPRIGLMIEVPSVLDLVDAFAVEADFFSIGTNDLIQYILAVDRTNEKVAGLYTPHHPAVLRAIKRVIDAAVRAGIDVSVCGEMAHDEQYIPFLVGAGVRTFSVNPIYLPKLQQTVSGLSAEKARKIADEILKQTRTDAIAELLKKSIARN